MPRGEVRIGIGGWTYPPWRGAFYPPKLAQSKELQFAAQAFGAIEINATFYGRQSPKSWAAWAAAVPDGFQFAIKGSRFCVTRRNSPMRAKGRQFSLRQGLSALGPAWTVACMLAARRKFDRDDIAAFLAVLPEKLDGVTLRHVIEPRHESFRDERFSTVPRP